MPPLQELASVYVPLVTAVISLISVATAFVTLYHSRQDRRESQRALEADARRREQEALLSALQGEKEAVGFMALQIAREPGLVTESNRTRLFCALCLAFVFESSSRARALILKALQKFSSATEGRGEIYAILDEMKVDFETYQLELGNRELDDYIRRITSLRTGLARAAAGAHTDTVSV